MKLRKFWEAHKRSSIIVLCLCAIAIVFFALRGSRTPKNPLLQGYISYDLMISPNGGNYYYKNIDVACDENKLSGLTKKEYVEFLERGVEGFADDVSGYRISFNDSETGIVYLNGDSSAGYYVDCSTSSYNTLSPSDPLCKVLGTITWDGKQVIYTASETTQRLRDVMPSRDSKYRIPCTSENQDLSVRIFSMW